MSAISAAGLAASAPIGSRVTLTQGVIKLSLDSTTVSQARNTLQAAKAQEAADVRSGDQVKIAQDRAAVKQAEDAEKRAEDKLRADQAAYGTAANTAPGQSPAGTPAKISVPQPVKSVLRIDVTT